MLVNITQKCNECCSHCLVAATPNGLDSTMDDIKKVCRYLNIVKPTVVVISGGEITLSSDWFEKCISIIAVVAQYQGMVILESNGSWFWDGRYDDIAPKMLDLLNLPTVTSIQLSSNKKYYPNYDKYIANLDRMKQFHSKVQPTHDWQGKDSHLARLGRAKHLVTPEQVTGKPSCAPLVTRLIQSQSIGVKDFTEFNLLMFTNGYFCKPMVYAMTGAVVFGETPYCTPYDNINRYSECKSDEEYAKMVYEWFKDFQIFRRPLFMCNGCAACKNIPQHIKDALSKMSLKCHSFMESQTKQNYDKVMKGEYIQRIF